MLLNTSASTTVKQSCVRGESNTMLCRLLSIQPWKEALGALLEEEQRRQQQQAEQGHGPAGASDIHTSQATLVEAHQGRQPDTAKPTPHHLQDPWHTPGQARDGLHDAEASVLTGQLVCWAAPQAPTSAQDVPVGGGGRSRSHVGREEAQAVLRDIRQRGFGVGGWAGYVCGVGWGVRGLGFRLRI